MRNFNFFKNLIIFGFLFSIFSLSAQGIIVEQTKISSNNGWKAMPNFDKNNYTTVLNEAGKKVHVSNQFINENNPVTGQDDVNDVTLNLNLIFDPEQFDAPWFVMVYNESGYMNLGFWMGENPITLNVPPGDYDIFAQFIDASQRASIIIKEQESVQGETTVDVNVADAVNHVIINAYDENGELLEPGIHNAETGYNSQILFNRFIHFLPSSYALSSYSYYIDETLVSGQDPMWNFHINNISDRYVVINSLIGVGFEAGNYFPKHQTLNGITESATLENDPERWVLHQEEFQASVLGASDGVYPGFSTMSTLYNFALGGWDAYYPANTINPEEAFRAYLDNPIDEDPSELLVFPAIADYIDEDPDWGDTPFFIKGNALVSNDSHEIIYGSGFSGWSDYLYNEGRVQSLPFHSRFSFSADDAISVRQGNNTPITVTATRIVPDTDSHSVNIQYKGRYGELRESDFFGTEVEVKQGGDIIFSGSLIDFTEFSLPFSAQLDIILTNTNIEVDGLAGKNITHTTYNAGETDGPPTLQMLQFRDTSGKVTDRFASAAEGTLRLATGDFQFNPDSFVYDYNEGNTVAVYYSVYGQEEWAQLELAQYPIFFQMPGFGDYYEASLADIQNVENDVWYDLRVICTDASGNKQEQIVSPAFKINDTMGVGESNHKSNFVVYPNPFSGELNIQLPENMKGNYTFKVTDLSGKTVHFQNRNADSAKSFTWNGSYLPKGVYICSIVSNGKTIAKKVIKK